MKQLLFSILVLLFPLSLFSQGDSSWNNSFIFNPDESELNLLSDKKLTAEQKVLELLKAAEQNSKRPVSIRKILMALTLEDELTEPTFAIAKVHIRFGDYLIDAGAPELGIQHSKKALEYLKKIMHSGSGETYNMIGKIASYYMLISQFDSSLFYYNLALEEAKEAKKTGEMLWLPAAYNNMGMLYQQFEQPAKASEYYDKAKQSLVLRSRGDSSLLVSILDNVAELESSKANYAAALKIYNEKLLVCEQIGMKLQYMKSEFGITRTYLLMKNSAKASEHLKLSEQYMQEKNLDHIIDKITLKELWQQYYELTGNWHGALQNQKWIYAANDSVLKQKTFFLNNVLQALTTSEVTKFKKTVELHKLQLAQKENDLKVAAQEARTNKIVIILFVIAAVIILAFVYLFFRSRSNVQKNLLQINQYRLKLAESNLKNRELEKEKLSHELEHKKGDLGNLALYLSNLKDLNAKMLKRVNDAKSKKPEEQKQVIKEISSEMLAQLSSDKKTALIQENVEQINKEFYDKLHNLFPTLTKSELELCGLLRLNMSNKEIGALKNSLPESVKMSRYRLRKKLGLKPEDDIYKFIIKI